MDKDTLRTLGLAIWWGEGTKSRPDKRWKTARSYPIEITNTNPQILITFLSFLREVISVPEEKLRVQIQVHANDNKIKLEKFWSTITGIPLSKFNKTIVRQPGNKPGKSLGTCKVRFSDKAIYLKLEKMLETELLKVGIDDHGIIAGNRGNNLLE